MGRIWNFRAFAELAVMCSEREYQGIFESFCQVQ
jgi:hypothetical protein